MGENFSIEIAIKGILRKAIIGILIGDSFTQQLIRGYTWEEIRKPIDLLDKTIIRCNFKEFPLMHGTYNIHIWVGRKGELSDFIENAATLRIELNDFFGTGRYIDPKGGLAFCKKEWIINNIKYE
jgi:hypothetical protein